jgi:hypothetical protein
MRQAVTECGDSLKRPLVRQCLVLNWVSEQDGGWDTLRRRPCGDGRAPSGSGERS